MERNRATTDEWREYYERADRSRDQPGDLFERHLKGRRLRRTLLNVFVPVILLGAVAVLTAWILSYLGDA